jgi:hypothetical protein
MEWEEWGNPLESAEVYAYMKGYSPYENVEQKQYPAILATTSLNDTRVYYHEPAKWIARLRATATGGDFLLKTEMEAGHGGRSGRYDAWREEALTLAWVITTATGGATATGEAVSGGAATTATSGALGGGAATAMGDAIAGGAAMAAGEASGGGAPPATGGALSAGAATATGGATQPTGESEA